jgi:2-polyprenyl-3-methyl-5-hydroxy-6-metoxy-1,4-benzoquinol methylase
MKENKYDLMRVDIESLFDNESNIKSHKRPIFFYRLYKRYSTALLIKLGLYERCVDAGFVRLWFSEFKNYWSSVLDGRPMYMHDFFFLLGIYRQRFQDVETPDDANVEEFLESWQNNETFYMLFGAVRLYAYHPFMPYPFEKWVKNGDTILEYGCGIAPITYYLNNYSLKSNLNYSIADIQQINSHYAQYRLKGIAKYIEIMPLQKTKLEKKYNVIFMVTVMEHLPNPIQTIENLTNNLKPSGIFIFDYILGDGDGQDTLAAINQRKEVLDYIGKKYTVLSGDLNYKESMGTTVCRKIINL